MNWCRRVSEREVIALCVAAPHDRPGQFIVDGVADGSPLVGPAGAPASGPCDASASSGVLSTATAPDTAASSDDAGPLVSDVVEPHATIASATPSIAISRVFILRSVG